MEKPKDPRADRIQPTDQQPTEPGPTSGGMGSVGQQPDEPSLEEKPGFGMKKDATTDAQHTGHAAQRGVAGFHHAPEEEALPEGSGGPATPAGMQLDAESWGRANTGTGDQPGNTGGSRIGTPLEPPPDTTATKAPSTTNSSVADLDHERSGGMSGGLG